MNHVTVFLGIEKDRAGRQIPHHERATALLALRQEAARVFGGYTLAHVEGGWIDNKGRLVEEGAVRWDFYTQRTRHAAFAWAQSAGKRLRQQSVLLDYNGSSEFVDTLPQDVDITIPELATV